MGVDVNESPPGGGGRSQSPLERLPAAWRLAGALALLLAVALMPRGFWAGLWVAAGLIAALLAASRIAPRAIVKRLLALEPLALGVAGLMLFQPGGASMFLAMVFKANLCLLTAFLLAQIVSFSELIQILKRLRVPWVFVR